MLKFICALTVIVVLAIAGVVTVTVIQDGRDKYDVSVEGVEIPEFSKIEVDFEHLHNGSKDLPFSAGAVIDVDNDGIEELFLGGGVLQADGLFLFKQDHFINVADQVGLVKQGAAATLAVVVLDVDDNGYRDLLVTRNTGIWLYRNTGGHFSSERIKVEFSGDTTPLSVAIADLNRDGHFDMFVPSSTASSQTGSKITFNSPLSSSGSKLFINNGDDSFTDVTDVAGIQNIQNGLQAIFINIDDDGLEDLVVLYTDGKVRIWRNLGSLLFENKKHFLSETFGLFMGLGVGDYNDDGNVDFFVSNSGSTVPEYLVKGDLKQNQTLRSSWVLMKNGGDFVFKDDADTTSLAGYGLSRGSTFVDLNLDGFKDLVVSQNHRAWPLHRLAWFRLPGRVFVQNRTGQFAEVSRLAGVENTGFSITPLTADFNQDGQPDIVYVNMAGRSNVFLSKRGANNYLKVQLPDSIRSLGAVVSAITLSGKVFKQPFLTGKELCSDSSHVLFFGLGKEKVTDVVVHYQNGEMDQTSGVLFNTTVVFK